jgi:CheY-like chemotaxis protein
MARVLIVNDHVPFVETLSRTIVDLRHEPIGVYGGMEILKAVVDDRPDLILLD